MFELEIFCNIINVLTFVSFGQFNAFAEKNDTFLTDLKLLNSNK